MKTTLRPGRQSDAEPCGQICWKAFTAIAQQHNFPPDFASPEVAQGLLRWVLSRPDVFSVVAESAGKVIGSNFLWESDAIAGVGPITIDPDFQNTGVGRLLMEQVLDRAAQKQAAGVRLVQAAYHARSLALYAKLGFEVREPLVTLQGRPLARSWARSAVRPAAESDVEACNRLCRTIHGHERKAELLGAIQQKTATVVERDGRISGYATAIGFLGHAVAESNDDLKALIAAAPEIGGPGFLLPVRNGEVFRWCLSQGLRVTQPMSLMSLGLYSEPRGGFLPSVLL